MSDEMESRDKRRYERTFCKIKITYTILTANDAAPYEYGVMASRDLSEGGLSVVTDRPVPCPILMQLNLSIPMRPFHLLILGKTIRCLASDDGLYEVGIKFVGILPPDFKQILTDFVVPESPQPASASPAP